MEDNRMVSFSLGGMAFEYDDNKNQITACLPIVPDREEMSCLYKYYMV